MQFNHIFMNFQTQGTVHCEICNKTYGQEHLLGRHMEKLHELLGEALFNRKHGHGTRKLHDNIEVESYCWTTNLAMGQCSALGYFD